MLWHDNMQVLLGPETVDYRIYSPLRRTATVVGSVLCPPGAPHPWSAACDALREIIEAERPRRLRLEVILSDRFVRYQVLPWREGLNSRAEWRAYALHCFEVVYGESVRQWNVRLDIVPPVRQSLACAIDTELISMLQDIAKQGFSRIASIRTDFVHSYGKHRSSSRGQQFWFAVVEDRQICLGAWRQGYWVAIHNQAAPDGWRIALPGLLRRARFAIDQACDGDLYLAGPAAEIADADDLLIDAINVHVLPVRAPGRGKADNAASGMPSR